MAAALSPARSGPAGDAEQRFILRGVSWSRYVALRELLDGPGLRMAYCRGTLELMSPSSAHENVKTLIARLVEIYAMERDVPLHGGGSTTFRREASERGLEPDECYFLLPRRGEYPDIAIEVVIQGGGIDKLDIYRGLGVREVWFWENDAFHLHALGPDGYAAITRSALVP